MRQPWVSAVLAVGLTLAMTVAPLIPWQSPQPPEPHVASGGIGHPLYTFDPSDERALASYATDIFLGRVIARTGAIGAPTTAPGQELPQSQFAVEVLQTVKGEAAGIVTVNQIGGLDSQAGRVMRLEGDALLRPGTTELFLVAHVPASGRYQIVAAGYGHLPVVAPSRRDALLERFAQVVNEPSQSDEPIDFIRFDGAVYLAAAYLAEDALANPSTAIGAGDLGPVVGQVVTNWVDGPAAAAYPNEPCAWDTLDGTAPQLAPGDQLYAVRGYATTFRIAARRDGEIVPYQVWCSDRAKVGADLFDIAGRVDRISVTADQSESSGWAVIAHRPAVDRLVAMILDGPVLPAELTATTPSTLQLVFHLDDGTTFRASAAPGELLWGMGAVAVPAAFTATLERAWARQTATPAPALDPACVRFDDPNAVVNGELPFVSFTAYRFGVDHAVAAWSLARGFAVVLREIAPAGDAVPEAANLIYRDVAIPGSAFKGVTVTWVHAPATITLNRATLPPPDAIGAVEQDLIRSVVTHETGHALGLGDVPAPGVNIRECGEMLMKRSVDKAGGHITAPGPGDIALYCMRWGGAICGDASPPAVTPLSVSLAPGVRSTPVATPFAGSLATYRYLVVACAQLPAEPITPDRVEGNDLPADPLRACVRAPAGIVFQVRRDDGGEEVAMTDRFGELTFQKPEGVAVVVDLPEGRGGNYPSLLGYRPAEPFDHIPAHDPACPGGGPVACERVYVLVP